MTLREGYYRDRDAKLAFKQAAIEANVNSKGKVWPNCNPPAGWIFVGVDRSTPNDPYDVYISPDRTWYGFMGQYEDEMDDSRTIGGLQDRITCGECSEYEYEAYRLLVAGGHINAVERTQ